MFFEEASKHYYDIIRLLDVLYHDGLNGLKNSLGIRNTYIVRIIIPATAIIIFLQNIYFGLGFGTFHYYLPTFFTKYYLGVESLEIENALRYNINPISVIDSMFVEILYSVGIIGTVLFLIPYIRLFNIMRRVVLKSNHVLFFSLSFINLGLLMFLVSGVNHSAFLAILFLTISNQISGVNRANYINNS